MVALVSVRKGASISLLPHEAMLTTDAFEVILEFPPPDVIR
jgi:hypothetical protein